MVRPSSQQRLNNVPKLAAHDAFQCKLVHRVEELHNIESPQLVADVVENPAPGILYPPAAEALPAVAPAAAALAALLLLYCAAARRPRPFTGIANDVNLRQFCAELVDL